MGDSSLLFLSWLFYFLKNDLTLYKHFCAKFCGTCAKLTENGSFNDPTFLCFSYM